MCVTSICQTYSGYSTNIRYSFLTCSNNALRKPRNHMMMRSCHSCHHLPRQQNALQDLPHHLRNWWRDNPPEGAPLYDVKTPTLCIPVECATYLTPNYCMSLLTRITWEYHCLRLSLRTLRFPQAPGQCEPILGHHPWRFDTDFGDSDATTRQQHHPIWPQCRCFLLPVARTQQSPCRTGCSTR